MLSRECLAAGVTQFLITLCRSLYCFWATRGLSMRIKSLLLLFVCAQGDNGDEELAPTEVDGQFEFQAKDNIPPGGFKFC